MLSAILAFLQMLPVVGNIVTALSNSYFNAKVAITQARVGGDRDVAVEIVKKAAVEDHENTARLSMLVGNKVMVWIVAGFALGPMLFTLKIYLVDKIIGPGCIWAWSWSLGWHPSALCWIGNTDPIGGDVADWSRTIVYSLFGSGTALALGNMWFSRRSQG